MEESPQPICKVDLEKIVIVRSQIREKSSWIIFFLSYCLGFLFINKQEGLIWESLKEHLFETMAFFH